MPQAHSSGLILASTSKARQMLLAAAGVQFQTTKPEIDESLIKENHRGLSARELAAKLAMLKSVEVSKRVSASVVIGADQTLDLAGQGFDKPGDVAAARSQLLQLRGKTHSLHSAICCSKDGAVIWQHVSMASMAMRDFSDSELASYMRNAGDKVLQSVGAYQVEGPAIQLFESIDGDYFTILGLPLLPLLKFLREYGALPQ